MSEEVLKSITNKISYLLAHPVWTESINWKIHSLIFGQDGVRGERVVIEPFEIVSNPTIRWNELGNRAPAERQTIEQQMQSMLQTEGRLNRIAQAVANPLRREMFYNSNIRNAVTVEPVPNSEDELPF